MGGGGCEWRNENFVKIKQYMFFLLFFWGEGGGGLGQGVWLGGSVGWEQRSEACAKIKKKNWGGGGGGGAGGVQGGCEWRRKAFVKIQ